MRHKGRKVGWMNNRWVRAAPVVLITDEMFVVWKLSDCYRHHPATQVQRRANPPPYKKENGSCAKASRPGKHLLRNFEVYRSQQRKCWFIIEAGDGEITRLSFLSILELSGQTLFWGLSSARSCLPLNFTAKTRLFFTCVTS